jgi:hypothetical protein
MSAGLETFEDGEQRLLVSVVGELGTVKVRLKNATSRGELDHSHCAPREYR